MSDYRDDRRALEYQNEALSERLAETQEALARREAEVRQQQVELDQLRAAAPPALLPPVAGLVRCAPCGKENQAHYKFCLGCGVDLTATPVVAHNELAAQPVAGAERYVLIIGLIIIGVVAAGVFFAVVL